MQLYELADELETSTATTTAGGYQPRHALQPDPAPTPAHTPGRSGRVLRQQPSMRRGAQLIGLGLFLMTVVVLVGSPWLMLVGFPPLLAGCHQIGCLLQEDVTSPS